MILDGVGDVESAEEDDTVSLGLDKFFLFVEKSPKPVQDILPLGVEHMSATEVENPILRVAPYEAPWDFLSLKQGDLVSVSKKMCCTQSRDACAYDGYFCHW